MSQGIQCSDSRSVSRKMVKSIGLIGSPYETFTVIRADSDLVFPLTFMTALRSSLCTMHAFK